MESLGYNPNAFYELEIENDLEPEEIKRIFCKTRQKYELIL